MPLSFYMDVHVPAAVTAGLRRRGISVLTSHEDGTDFADDGKLLDRATALQCVLFTQDTDFLRIATESKTDHCGIVFARQNSCSIGALVHDLQLIAEACSKEEMMNRVVFLPL
jgi:predicted nuclease of predicted toxin-antitoxin system